MKYNLTIKSMKSSHFYNNMERPEGHYVKCHKPGKERQVLHNLTHMWIFKVDFIEIESRTKPEEGK